MPLIALLYALAMITTSIGSVCGNVMLLLVVAFNTKLQTETWALTLNFCICDLILGLSAIPFGIHNSLSGVEGYDTKSILCQSNAFVYVLLQLASVHSLTWATIDKFTEICFALQYAQLFTKKRTWVILSFLWMYCLLNACFPFMGFGSYRYSENKFICMPRFQPSSKSYSIIIIVIGVIIPIMIMCSLYIYIVYIARNQALRGTFVCNDQHCYYVPANNYIRSSIVMISTAVTSHNSDHAGSSNKNLRKVCLLVCWMPYITVSFFETFTEYSIPPVADAVATWLVLLTSALNPWVNSMTQKKYRKALRGSLKKLRQR
uniref:G-protein coupled receptors family 1 profile domain-containing protein n=1 Tax=Lepisosteus oculatus TaxID=7918 RepID=W5MT03_LEPOC